MAKAKSSVPEGHHTVTPQLTLEHAAQTLEWYAKALGAKRVLPLPVSAPFHCSLMKPAETRLAPELRAHLRNPGRGPSTSGVATRSVKSKRAAA